MAQPGLRAKAPSSQNSQRLRAEFLPSSLRIRNSVAMIPRRATEEEKSADGGSGVSEVRGVDWRRAIKLMSQAGKRLPRPSIQ